jgi:hypothetical protein
VSTLDTRYGRSPARARRVAGWVPVAVVFAVVGLAWLGWAAWNASRTPVTATITAYDAVSARQMDVRLEVTRRTDAAVTCELYAQAYDHSIVGETSVELPAGDAGTDVVTPTITTERLAFTAALRRCDVVTP